MAFLPCPYHGLVPATTADRRSPNSFLPCPAPGAGGCCRRHAADPTRSRRRHQRRRRGLPATATATSSSRPSPPHPAELYATQLGPKIAYLDEQHRTAVISALTVAHDAHDGQKRKSGDPFIIHPVAVACILADMKMDRDTVIAGLLHDTVEDTDVTLEEVERMFGSDVRRIVEGETKLSKLATEVHASASWADSKVKLTESEWDLLVEERRRGEKADQQATYLRNMFLAMTEDVRVIIVKLADRLHNMQTLQFMPRAKQERISKETLEIFAPLAHRLGMFRIKCELEDLSFRYLYPGERERIVSEIERLKKTSSLEQTMEDARALIEAVLNEDMVLKPMINDIAVRARLKEPYQLFRKARRAESEKELLMDAVLLEIVVDLDSLAVGNDALPAYEKNVCYHVLGRVHAMWRPLPGSIKDYIANPKPNGYQSLHTKVALGPELGFFPVEVQIQTDKMHRIAEEGIVVELFSSDGSKKPDHMWQKAWTERTMMWLRSIREYCFEFSQSSSDCIDAVQVDLLGKNRVFVLTPKGKIFDLPQGSSVIDLAFKIHSDIGERMVGANINGKSVGLNYVLKNADMVKIITSDTSNGPAPEWISFARTRTARQKIRRHLQQQKLEERIATGRLLLRECAQDRGEPIPSEVALVEILPLLATVSGLNLKDMRSVEDLYRTIAEFDGKDRMNLESTILNILREKRNAVFRQSTLRSYDGSDSSSTQSRFFLAQCCRPVRGDTIIGCRCRSDGGMSIHRNRCSRMMHFLRNDPSKCVGLAWKTSTNSAGRTFDAEIDRQPATLLITAGDSAGLLSCLSGLVTKAGIPIMGSSSSTNARRIATLQFQILVTGKEQLDAITSDLANYGDDIIEVRRIGTESPGHFDQSHRDGGYYGDSVMEGGGGFEIGTDVVEVLSTGVSEELFS